MLMLINWKKKENKIVTFLNKSFFSTKSKIKNILTKAEGLRIFKNKSASLKNKRRFIIKN